MIKIPFYYDYVFPNSVLPNASLPEFAIINYINSQYTNRFKHENMFEIELDGNPEGVLNKIFGEHFGTMPNSLRQGGTYLKSKCYRHLVQIMESSVYYGKARFQKYVYPIKTTLHFDRFTGFDRLGSKMNGEFFWKHISQEALGDIRSGQAVILLDYANENFIHKHEFEELNMSLKRSGIPKNQIVLSINSFNAQELYENWFAPEERMLEVRNLPFLMTNISYFFGQQAPHTCISNPEFFRSRSEIRKHYFLFPNRRSRPHRMAFLAKLASDNLLDFGNWSVLEENNSLETFLYEAEKIFQIDRNSVSINLKNKIPHNLEEEPNKLFLSECGWDYNGTKEHYKNSYFYIASETFIDLEYKSLTEKVFKPIANLMPFVFISFPKSLEVLRNLGFKTFHPFIDESYDQEIDHANRLRLVYHEIYKLCQMTKEEIHNWYWSMEDILMFNKQHLFEIYKSEKHTVELIEFLYKKVK